MTRFSRPLRITLATIAVALLAGAGSVAYVASQVPRPLYGPERSLPLPAPKVDGTWDRFAGDAGAQQYSPLSQINAGNAGQLEVAWTYRTGEMAKRGDDMAKSAFAMTPIMVSDMLVGCSPWNKVFAIDPATGREKWSFDPRITIKIGPGSRYVCRGVAHWRDPKVPQDAPCADRIVFGTNDARIFALDSRTGRQCAGFGRDGQVQVRTSTAEHFPGEMKFNAPPAIVGDVAVFGSFVFDGNRRDRPLGTVRAFDLRTGAPRWSFDPVPQGRADPRAATWRNGANVGYGGGNVWADMAVDEARGMVFLPTSSASMDLWAGYRPGDNRDANSVVALDAKTGRRIWAYQIVHHDVWDFDLPTAPILADVPVNGRTVPAVIQLTKQGLIFVLDRMTGKPILPVEERKVPQSHAPGESLSPTQPFPTAMPALMPQRLDEKDAWGFTPFDREACRAKIAQFKGRGIYAPLTRDGVTMYPLATGGTNLGMRSYDPQRRLLIANTIRVAGGIALAPRDEDKLISPQDRKASGPFKVTGDVLMSPLGVPCNPPPWGALTAIDMVTHKIVWQIPLGTTEKLAPLPIPLAFGTPNRGGPMTTGGGLIFIAATMDDAFRVISTDTGRELFKTHLPAGGQATPMTYMAGGRQYVVIAAGGHDTMKTTPGDYLVAFALPKAARQ